MLRPHSSVYSGHAFLKITVFALIAGFPAWLGAQKPKTSESFEIIPQENTEYTTTAQMRVDQSTGFPVALYSINFPVIAGNDAEAQARQFLANYRNVLGLEKADLSDLRLKTSRKGLSGTVVRFHQMHQGWQVYGAEVTVAIDNANTVQFAMCSYKHQLQPISGEPVITAATARQLAVEYIGLTGPVTFEQNQTVVVQLNGQTHLCHRLVIAGQSPVGEWEFLTDAFTGEFLKVADNALYCHPHSQDPAGHEEDSGDECEPLPPLPPTNGTGNTFDADPLSSAAATYGGSYVDGNDANAAVLTAQLANRTLLSIDLTSGTYSLRGPYAYIVDHEAPNKGLFTQASSIFNFDRNADGFEAANTYYHIDQSMRYLNLTLGVTVMPYQYATGVQYDPSGLSGADNSHYTGGSGRLAFGEGGVDDAEDSDVILHELGHGLHDWITSGGLSNNQGLSEGTGDYWTQSYSRSLNQWTTAQAAYHWVFNWDGHNPFWGGRITNYGAVYPGGLTGAIHTDGQIWSTCMMRIYDQIGRTATDRVLWEGLNLTNGTATQNDAAVAVRQAAINMGYTNAQLNIIITILGSCGYTVPPAPLGLQTVSFDAERVSGESVVLTWNTLTACNVKTFAIERRLAGENNFVTVGTVLSTDLCSAASFHFTDANAAPGMSFYRLRETDVNGGTSYTEVKVVNGFSGGFQLFAWPQPAQQVLNCWMGNAEELTGTVQVEILTLGGQRLAQFNTEPGLNNGLVEIPVSEFNDGMYILRATHEGMERSMRFSVIH